MSFFKVFIIKYFLKRKAPQRVTYSSDRVPKVFGYWVYLGKPGDCYIVLNHLKEHTYKCKRVDAREGEEIESTQSISDDGFKYNNDIRVKLFFNGLELTNLNPTIAFVIGVTHFYRIIKLFENLRWKRSSKQNKKAFVFYCDRLRMLEALIDIRNNQHEEDNLFAERISEDDLVKYLSKGPIVTGEGYYTYIKPILKGLELDKAIQFIGDSEIEVLPPAWAILSQHYVEERRHRDITKMQFMVVILTLVLALAAIGSIFNTEVRSFVYFLYEIIFE